jgi:ribose transport system ATP-binding protein
MSLVEMTGLTKRFGGILALDGVDLTLNAGEIVGLMGENGAGKSTLMRILSGAETPDEGILRVSNQEETIESPNHALALGIGMIPQELILVNEMTVEENLFLGRELRRAGPISDRAGMRRIAAETLSQVGGQEISPEDEVGSLSKADQQLVAIARRILQGGRIFIMDEPTSALTEKETERLFSVMRSLTGDGNTVVFISHRLEEVLEICDRFAILRDGKMVARFANGPEIGKTDLVRHMIGSDVSDEYPHQSLSPGEVLMCVKDLSFANNQGRVIGPISFDLHAGEIVGITGLVGAGKTELAQAVVGLRKRIAGTVSVKGNTRAVHNPVQANRSGIGYVSEDRRGEGLVLGLLSLRNMTISVLRVISTMFTIIAGREKELGDRFAERLNMKPEYLELAAGKLSGGNQQKVVLSRRLMGDSAVLMLDEPTKGIDVGAKAEIARLLGDFAREGRAILVLSSEPREILGVSDRILVLSDDGVHGPFARGELDYQSLMDIEFGTQEVRNAK